MSKGAQIAVGAALVVALLGWYGWSSLEGGSYRYYRTLDELRAEPPADRPVRVHGFVATGSIERDVPGKQVRFHVQGEAPHAGGEASDTLPVVYQSLETPDLFQDGAEVVVEGRFGATGDPSVLVADNVLAKCPSKFEAEVADAPQGGDPARL